MEGGGVGLGGVVGVDGVDPRVHKAKCLRYTQLMCGVGYEEEPQRAKARCVR